MGGSDRSAAPFGIRCLGGPKAGVTHLSSSQRRCFWTLNRWHFWVASMVMWYGHAPRSVHTAWGTLAPAQGSHPRQGEGLRDSAETPCWGSQKLLERGDSPTLSGSPEEEH